MIILRSLLYQLFLVLSVALYGGAIAALGRWVPLRIIGGLARAWGHANLRALKLICRLGYSIQGLENVPATPCIILCKHQSAWETIALRALLPVGQTWVLKQELLRIPILGSALRQFRPIAIDRSSGRQALKQLVTQGQALLAAGRLVVIYPEGTRVPAGVRGSYSIGGAVLADRSGYPIVPIAHNAGVYWGRRALRKYPGTIQVVVGPAIVGTGKSAQEINEEAEDWIESTMLSLPTTNAACV